MKGSFKSRFDSGTICRRSGGKETKRMGVLICFVITITVTLEMVGPSTSILMKVHALILAFVLHEFTTRVALLIRITLLGEGYDIFVTDIVRRSTR